MTEVKRAVEARDDTLTAPSVQHLVESTVGHLGELREWWNPNNDREIGNVWNSQTTKKANA